MKGDHNTKVDLPIYYFGDNFESDVEHEPGVILKDKIKNLIVKLKERRLPLQQASKSVIFLVNHILLIHMFIKLLAIYYTFEICYPALYGIR